MHHSLPRCTADNAARHLLRGASPLTPDLMRPLLQPIAPEIDDPLALLTACHEKVRRFSTLTRRLVDHVGQRGADAEARDAATSVLRYFDLAAPLHHEDEDLYLFPALRSLGHPDVTAHIARLQAEHDELGALWQATRPWLLAVQAGKVAPGGAAPEAVLTLTERYPAHADAEEAWVYPAAAGLSPEQCRSLSAAMVARRRTP